MLVSVQPTDITVMILHTDSMRFQYRVLYTRVYKQNEVCRILSASMPKGHGKVFVPQWEYWRRDRKEIDTKPLFPGYIFFHTDLTNREIHALVVEQRKKIRTFIRELGYQEERSETKNTTAVSDSLEEDCDEIYDVSPEEAAFLDQMLDEEGVERMSEGYLDSRVVVVEGPLLAYQDRIVGRDLHNRVAWLDLMFRDTKISAGLNIRPKEEFLNQTSQKRKDNSKLRPQSRKTALQDEWDIDISDLIKRMNG